jgi:hypothetical protein
MSELRVGKVVLYPPTTAREWPNRIDLPVTSDGTLEARLNRLDKSLYDLHEKVDALSKALLEMAKAMIARGSL